MLYLIVEKGGKTWVATKREDCSYIQCLSCGEVYIMERKIPISVSVVRSECPRCHHIRGLNCGNSEMDVMELKDWTLDDRYFNYEK